MPSTPSRSSYPLSPQTPSSYRRPYIPTTSDTPDDPNASLQHPGLAHRSSKSMSSLSHVFSQAEGSASGSGSSGRLGGLKEAEDRRRSVDSPSVHRKRRSEGLPDWLNGGREERRVKRLDLPANPREWTPSDLSQYLAYELRTGGVDHMGKTLPAPLIRDIESWVFRQRVSGKVFLSGSSDGWGSSTSKPPPFLPLLQYIARRLRRQSLSRPPPVHPSNPGSPTLFEEDELFEDEDEGVFGVKRMVIDYDARSSASEASGDESDHHDAPRLLAQHTGDSVIERWRKWEETGGEMRPPEHEEYIQGYGRGDGGRKRNVSNVSATSAGSVNVTPARRGSETKHSSPTMEELLKARGDDTLEVGDDGMGGATIKAVPPTASAASAPLTTGSVITPSSPYTTPMADTSSAPADTKSVTPTPDRPPGLSSLVEADGENDDTPEATPSKSQTSQPRQTSDGSSRYTSLGRSDRRHPREHSQDDAADSDDPEEGEAETGRWESARRVTLRPTRAMTKSISALPVIPSVEAVESKANEKVRDAEKEVAVKGEVAIQVDKLVEKIKELEARLEVMSTSTPAPPASVDPLPEANPAPVEPQTVLTRLGLGGGDGTLGYVFLIGLGAGVGVGAIVMRILRAR
ncbi:hypothetical protein L202_05981 [Cryptococcus amylolentus CBS 6039]|uniref:Uncharacterized protein n=3 Tax=Cryptococcus amylolentus CBS 6039 TaxID=1295533 RepID=A0A1E3HI47_9TREE|nr:hypothetical protein L202_05981 [Cryptococcus amylolentus CBS 6039]ODN76027.1 hypothetical protein L202_05981 [Cryptococcus amylolentus CBS 6039]